MIDEATSQLTARFVRHDSTEENLRLLWSYLEQHGRPVAFYTDKASLFQTAPKIARDQKDAGHDLAAILSWVETRQVGNDYTLRIYGHKYQIARASIQPGLRGASASRHGWMAVWPWLIKAAI